MGWGVLPALLLLPLLLLVHPTTEVFIRIMQDCWLAVGSQFVPVLLGRILRVLDQAQEQVRGKSAPTVAAIRVLYYRTTTSSSSHRSFTSTPATSPTTTPCTTGSCPVVTAAAPLWSTRLHTPQEPQED
jgi:hypothetical protein